MGIRFGVCASAENAGLLAGIGFDYIELGLAYVASLPEGGYADLKAAVLGSGIKAEAFNLFFPHGIKLTGPEYEPGMVAGYAKAALARAAGLGAEIAVVGSGRSRQIPDGFPRAEAERQFAESLRIVGEAAAAHGIVAVIEPLNARESNIANSVSESLGIMEAADHPNVRVLADFFHIREMDEGYGGVLEAGDRLRHVHISNAAGRAYPKASGEDDYGRFRDALKAIGYAGRMSVEAQTADFAKDAEAAIAFLRPFFGD
ncbi:MAG: sugar phosphate isomerase/epimerase [Oscillospiraceae bacterium]|nr:sugar phosphate isomerase/epimerase [Oscillospiraceae bacterium]